MVTIIPNNWEGECVHEQPAGYEYGMPFHVSVITFGYVTLTLVVVPVAN